jgi:hypothetical protein
MYSIDDWQATIGKEINNLTKGLTYLDAAERQKVSPVGLDPQDQRFQTNMPPAQRTMLKNEFTGIVNATITALQNGLTLDRPPS